MLGIDWVKVVEVGLELAVGQNISYFITGLVVK